MNSQEFWARVAELKESLPPQEYFIVYSLDVKTRGYKGGSMTEVDRQDAARLIALGSHRLATEAEIEENKKMVELRRKDYEARELHRLQNSGLRVVVQNQPVASPPATANVAAKDEPPATDPNDDPKQQQPKTKK